MTHFEYMEKQGQLTIFYLLDQYEEIKKSSTTVYKIVDKKKYKGASKRGFIVRR